MFCGHAGGSCFRCRPANGRTTLNTEADGQANCGAEAADRTRDARGQTPVVLSARGLKRAFGKVRAVDGLDLTVHSGEIYGFLGVNGAGKTTAIRLLMGIIKPDEGSL